MTPANLHLIWAEHLIDGLVRAGVRRAVISPGSRSTPLVLAAAQHPRVHTTVVIDERDAAFFALGVARVGDDPPLLICTSGTAAAHYFAAVIESSQAYLPLIVLTADRPPELHHRAAPQTIDQERLYGSFTRRSFQLGLPDADTRALRGLWATAALAVHTARSPVPGPVHLNAWFRKPLEPQPANDDDRDLRRSLSALRDAAPPALAFAAHREPARSAVEALTGAIAEAERGIIACGALPVSAAAHSAALAELSQATGFPLFVEATSQMRFADPGAAPRVDLFDPLLRAGLFDRDGAPDLVLRFGAPLCSMAWQRWFDGAPAVASAVVAEHGWSDPQNTAGWIIEADLDAALAALCGAVPRDVPPSRRDWSARLVEADRRAAGLAADVAGATGAAFGEPLAVRTAIAALPAGALLALGNSLPVRVVDQWCDGALARCGVVAQRGANGIDGLISGAAGTAAASARPVLQFLGDVSFQHDVGGLAVARTVTTPLVCVVLANGGGRLFEELPLAGAAGARAAFERLFLTPPVIEIGAAASAFGITHVRAATARELDRAVTAAIRRAGCTVIEAAVAPTSARDDLRRLVDALG